MYLSVCQSVCLSVCLSVSVYVFVSPSVCACICVCTCVCLSSVCLLSVCLSLCLSFFLCVFVSPSVCVCICMCVCACVAYPNWALPTARSRTLLPYAQRPHGWDIGLSISWLLRSSGGGGLCRNCRRSQSLKPVLNWTNVCSPKILRTVRRRR